MYAKVLAPLVKACFVYYEVKKKLLMQILFLFVEFNMLKSEKQ